jgi:hypothetical protein
MSRLRVGSHCEPEPRFLVGRAVIIESPSGTNSHLSPAGVACPEPFDFA